ncbi:helix-turn-helix transcriptional regulator [uncultured Sharpea sp.]|uniref:helix-turn-helix transcriptional regulator n=1 Tax=uncultured Sharpea sp. TaxID=1112738 RepID=UPI0025877D3A|nr:helix-turn-helix transcriptional regulator [uncultured Sharpea sp.]
MMRLITTLITLRNNHHMTQEDLSKIVGVSRETIGRLERGEYNPSYRLVYEIAHVFGKNVEEVFFYQETDD